MLPENIVKTFLKFFRVIYRMEKRRNITREIKAIKKLFKNNCDTLSRSEIDEIRTNLYKKQLIYDFLSTKSNLNDDERRVFKRIPKYRQKLHTDL